MEPILIGYVAKSIALRPDGLRVPVREVASVSGCIAARPEGWIEHWSHNDWFVYDSPDEALRVASSEANVRLYAYSVVPLVFGPAGEEPLAITGVSPVPLDARFRVIGYDVVSRELELECSPLSCNELGSEVAVNELCLIPSLEAALAFARRCGVEQPEPGTYVVVEVAATSA